MTLTCWLPLLGTTENQGSGNIIATNNGAVIDNNGKIGKCYSFNGNNYYIALTGQELFDCFKGGTAAFSICMWVYHADTRRAVLFGDYGLSNSIGFNIELNTGHNLRFYWNGSPDYSPGLNVGLNTWNHIALTYDGASLKSYLNGNLVATRSGALATRNKVAGEFRLGRDYRTTDTALNGKLNDIRVYGDHCLSAAEVHEIAQGLVLHYKLDGPMGGSGINLLRGSNQIGGSGIYGWINNGGSSNFSIEKIDNNTLHFKGTPNNNKSIPSITTNIVAPCEWGKTYTYQMELKFDKDIKLGNNVPMHDWPGARQNNVITETSINGHANGYSISYVQGYGGVTLPANTWQKIISKITFPASPPDASYPYPAIRAFVYGSVLLENTNTEVNVWMRNCKIEEGTIATPWTPAPSEMGIDTTIVEDSSGYRHNGEIISELHTSNDTARYNSSTLFDGVDDCIIVPYNTVCPENIFTINLWFKKDALGSKNYETLFGGPSGFEMDTRAGAATSLSLYMASTRSGNRNSVTSLSLGNWYMVTMTRDGTKEKYYINGIFQSEIDAKAMPTGVYYIGAWASSTKQNYYGNISDFRIYCTPLLDTDIKQLYNVGMKVDNLGGVHSFELNESGNNRITKTGILEGNLMGESEFSHYLKYDSNIYIEPDGSAWVKIYHHNNPKGGSFSSTNDFVNGVYIDENRWFNVNVCNYIDKWELMVKGKYTAEDNEWKIRWIQDVNPMTATFAEVAVANITKITNSGGELYGSSPSAWGGLYAKKGSAYLTANNGTNGNWWGAVGSYSVYQNGIPGWGTSGTITTTGFNDLYVRIDNVDFNIVNASNTKNKVWNASTFIEM